MNELFGANVGKIFSVGELTRSIRGTLESRFHAVWVQGEISNYRKQASGHHYFTLKDQRAAISCVIFRSAAVNLRDALSDGAQVQIFGSITVFEARGQYQLNVEIVQGRGLGLLQAKFEALKRKLEAEGLFDPARKKALPAFPRRIGIVTSPTGAAIRDLLNVLHRRAPNVSVLLNPVRVQGTGAAAEIAAAIHELAQPSRQWAPLDLIVVARGGGSLEDLWEFNEEIVARAIAACLVPTVSAIGHEIDFTIADFVADLRAPTPSAAAELIVADAQALVRRASDLQACLQREVRRYLGESRARLEQISDRALTRELFARLRDAQQEVDFLRESLGRNLRQSAANARQRLHGIIGALRGHNPQRALEHRRGAFEQTARRLRNEANARFARCRERVQQQSRVLRALGPEATLGRGYSITRREDGRVLKSINDVSRGERIRTRLSDGEIESEIRS